MSSQAIQSIESLSLAAVTGGKAKVTTTKPATAPEKPNLGGDLLKGCFTGAGGALKKGVSAEDLAIGCATGAGKSVLEGLGKMFGK